MLNITNGWVVSFGALLLAGCGSSSSAGTSSTMGAGAGGDATGAGGSATGGAAGTSAGPGGSTGKGGSGPGMGGSTAGSGAAGGAGPGTGGSASGAAGASAGGASAGGTSAGGTSAGGTSAGGNAAGTMISGTFMGMPFTTSPTSLWIGMPDSNQTEVMYVFENPVDCATLGAPGWDAKIPNNTQVLEMKVFGTAPATFNVVKSATPKAGDASVNHSLSKTTPPSVESPGSGGTVTVTNITAGKNITGAFAVQFGADMLTGTFDATYCPGGVEP